MKAIFMPFKGSNNWAFINSWVNNYGPIGLVMYGNPDNINSSDFMIPIKPYEIETYNNKPLSYYENNKRYNKRSP